MVRDFGDPRQLLYSTFLYIFGVPDLKLDGKGNSNTFQHLAGNPYFLFFGMTVLECPKHLPINPKSCGPTVLRSTRTPFASMASRKSWPTMANILGIHPRMKTVTALTPNTNFRSKGFQRYRWCIHAFIIPYTVILCTTFTQVTYPHSDFNYMISYIQISSMIMYIL